VPFSKTFAPGEILTAADTNEFLLNQGYQYRERFTFTSSGTFVKADYPWLRAIRVRCVGGGGAGGGTALPVRALVAVVVALAVTLNRSSPTLRGLPLR
jgi:hypothetical protein